MILPNFSKTAWNWDNFGTWVGGARAGDAPPLRSAIARNRNSWVNRRCDWTLNPTPMETSKWLIDIDSVLIVGHIYWYLCSIPIGDMMDYRIITELIDYIDPLWTSELIISAVYWRQVLLCFISLSRINKTQLHRRYFLLFWESSYLSGM